MRTILSSIPREAWMWILGLAVIAGFAPMMDGHVTLCVPTLLGAGECWGCGLGRSVGLLVRGDVAGSFAAHPVGVLAVPVIIVRIVNLIRSARVQS